MTKYSVNCGAENKGDNFFCLKYFAAEIDVSSPVKGSINATLDDTLEHRTILEIFLQDLAKDAGKIIKSCLQIGAIKTECLKR